MSDLQILERLLSNIFVVTALVSVGIIVTVRAKVSMKAHYGVFATWLLIIAGCYQVRTSFSQEQQPLWLVGSIFVGSVLCFALFNWVKIQPKSTSTVPPTSIQTPLVGPITVSPIFNNSSVIQHEEIVDSVSPQPAVATPKLELLTPAYCLFIGETREWASQWIEAREGPHTALIADFKNPAGRFGEAGADCEWVIARLAFMSPKGKRVSVNSGCWLGHQLNRIRFEPGATHTLILAITSEGLDEVFTLENHRDDIPILIGRYHRHLPSVKPIAPVLIELPCNLEIVLTDENNRTVFDGHFCLSMGDDKKLNLQKQ